MAFERLTYTKSWKNPRDFPTYEPDEGTVRADLQQLHDEARDGINRLVDALNGASAASLLPISAVEGLAAQTVQEAIEEVFAAVISAAAAKIVNGSVSREKLEQTLLERIYGGRVWASMDAPTPADNPNTDFPVGQLWLRPAMTLENLASDAWTVDGGTVEETDGGWLFTTDGSQDYVKAVQTAVSGGVPGQQVLIRLALGALSEHFEEVSLYLNGMETELEESGIYEAELDAAGRLEIVILGQLYYAEEGADLEVAGLAAINYDALKAQFSDYESREDWSAELEQLQGRPRLEIPMAVWLQTAPGKWQQIAWPVLPVFSGGTGLAAVPRGALLYGTDGDSLAVLPAVENGILQWSEGLPQLVQPNTFAKNNGYPLIAVGQYDGIGGNGDRVLELELDGEPQFLIIYPTDGSCDTVCVANGGKSSRAFSYNGMPYSAWVTLSGRTLTFSNERRGNNGDQMRSEHMNAEGVTYNWIAVCGGPKQEEGDVAA